MADMGVGEAAAAEGAKGAGEAVGTAAASGASGLEVGSAAAGLTSAELATTTGVAGAGAGASFGTALATAGSAAKAALPYAQLASAANSLLSASSARRIGGIPGAPTPAPTPVLESADSQAQLLQRNAAIAALLGRGGRSSTILTSPSDKLG